MGVRYDKEAGKFHINIKVIAKKGLTLRKTERNLLSLFASILNPYRMLSPIVLPLKDLFQKLCTTSISWEDLLDEETCSSWDKWCLAGQSDEEVYMPRNFLPPEFSKARLVGFSDASELAYSAVVFMISENDEGAKNVTFIMSKSRIATVGGQTIPRLE